MRSLNVHLSDDELARRRANVARSGAQGDPRCVAQIRSRRDECIARMRHRCLKRPPCASDSSGLGRMGLPMCRNIMAAGFPLTVFSRTMSKSASLVEQGARAASSLASLAASSDVIITCLDTVAASESVYLDRNGLVANAPPGALLIDHSTIAPELAMRIARAARATEKDFLDAPVSGGPEGAANATLSIMVGGSSAAFDRGLPVMRAYGKTIRHMGDAGSGTHAKLVNQLLTFAHAAAAAEAIALAQRVGLDLDALGDVLRASFGHSRMLDRTLARVQKADYRRGRRAVIVREGYGASAGCRRGSWHVVACGRRDAIDHRQGHRHGLGYE